MIFLLIIIFFWKFILFINFPFINSDGPWTLGHLFSILAGNLNASTFGLYPLGEIFKTHVLEIILFPFYSILPTNTYTFIAVNFLFIACTIVLIYFIIFKQYKDLNLFWLANFGFLSSTYTYGMRSENYIIPLLLLIILLFNLDKGKGSLASLLSIAFFCSIVAFIHPVGGITATIIILSRLIEFHNYIKSLLIIIFSGIILSIVITWGEAQSYIEYYLTAIGPSGDHDFWLMGFPKYMTFSVGIIPLMVLSINKSSVKSITMLTFMIILLSFFGRSYYFHYLFVILISLISNPTSKEFSFSNLYSNRIYKYSFRSCILVSMLFTHFSPTFLFLENKELGKNYRAMLSKVDSLAKRQNLSNLLWVPAQFGMEVIDQRNTRLHYHFHESEVGEKIRLESGDKMLFFSKEKMDKIFRKQISNPLEQLLIEKLIKPNPGYLRIGTFYRERADSLGLWSISLKSDFDI